MFEAMPMPANEPVPESEASTVPQPKTEIFANEENWEEPVSGTAPTEARPVIEPETLVMPAEDIFNEESIPGTERMPASIKEETPLTTRSAPYEPVTESGVRSVIPESNKTPEGAEEEKAEEVFSISAQGNRPVPPDMNLPPHVASILNPEKEKTAPPEDQQKAA